MGRCCYLWTLCGRCCEKKCLVKFWQFGEISCHFVHIPWQFVVQIRWLLWVVNSTYVYQLIQLVPTELFVTNDASGRDFKRSGDLRILKAVIQHLFAANFGNQRLQLCQKLKGRGILGRWPGHVKFEETSASNWGLLFNDWSRLAWNVVHSKKVRWTFKISKTFHFFQKKTPKWKVQITVFLRNFKN